MVGFGFLFWCGCVWGVGVFVFLSLLNTDTIRLLEMILFFLRGFVFLWCLY